MSALILSVCQTTSTEALSLSICLIHLHCQSFFFDIQALLSLNVSRICFRLPAAMPMYQSMPGVASPHLYNWPAHAAALPGMVAAGFPPMTAQGSTVTSMPPQNAGFPGIAVGFPGVPVAMAGFPGLHVPAAGFPGLPGVRPGFSDLGGARPGFLGMTSKAPAVAGASSAAQADDDYDS